MSTTYEIYTDICNSLRYKIRQSIKGYSTVGANAENDSIEIHISCDGFEFGYTIGDVLSKSTTGIDSDAIVDDVKRQMTKNLMRKYFY